MANPNRLGGTIFLSIGGERQGCKGNFSYNIGSPKRDPIIGASEVQGYSEKTQVPMIEGEITDRPDLTLKDILEFDGDTVTLELANGKVIMLSEAWYAGEGNVSTEEGAIAVLIHARRGEELL